MIWLRRPDVLTGTWIKAARPPRGFRAGAGAVLLAAALALAPHGVRAQGAFDCHNEQAHGDHDRRIAGCSELIEGGGLGNEDMSTALATRALSYSLKGQYGRAIDDYDRAIGLQPNFPVALNNRAWAYFRWGRAAEGSRDIERSLALDPTSAHSFDTRAHIRQVTGQPEGALADYWAAMRLGGARMIRMYQCGLTEQGLYKGALDGLMRPELSTALVTCVRSSTCDPLPADEQCRAATS